MSKRDDDTGKVIGCFLLFALPIGIGVGCLVGAEHGLLYGIAAGCLAVPAAIFLGFMMF